MCIAQTATSPQAKHENEGIDAMNVANVTGSPKVRWQVTVKSKEKWLHFSICVCHPCAGAMLIFSVSFQVYRMISEENPM